MPLNRFQQAISINPQSRYGRNLRLAMLGRGLGSAIAYDSGPLRGRGVLTGMALTDWRFADQLQRAAWVFDGTGGYIASGVSPVIGSPPFSIGCWVYSNFTAAGDGTLIHWGNAGVANQEVWLSIDSDGNVLTGSGVSGRIWATVVTTQTWTHLLAVYPGSTTLEGTRLWVNGREASGSAGSAITLSLGTTDTARIGAQISSAFFNMQGAIADLCVWSEAFTDGDARQLSRREDVTLGGAILLDPVANHYDWEGVR